MDRLRHMLLVASTLALALPLAGCDTLPDFSNPDPTEWFNIDFLHNKKPLPGERKELFPGGVPGVTRGVPPELVKGNQPPPTTDLAQTPVTPGQQQVATGEEEKPEAGAEAAANPEPKPKPKPKPRPKVAAKAMPQMQAPPSTPPTQVTVRRPDAPPPAQQAAPAQPQPQWPDPPRPSGAAPAAAAPASPGGVQWPDPPAAR
jgi:outer membrane biosynthesis protein TonB